MWYIIIIIVTIRRISMEIIMYLAAFAVLIVFFAYQSSVYKKQRKDRLRKHLEKQWGNKPDREYKGVEFDRIRKYFDVLEQDKYIDDITWNDMGMDGVFKSMNYTQSSIGEDCLYNRLRSMNYSDDELKEFDRVVSFFESDFEKCREYQEIFAGIGRTKSISVYDFIHHLADLGERKNGKHMFLAGALLLAIASIFVYPPIGIVASIVMVVVNVIQYYRTKAQVENYFICCGYLVGVIVHGKALAGRKDKELESYFSEIDNICHKLSGITKRVYLMGTNNMSGSIAEMLMEYVRMLFHVDLMKFNSIQKMTVENIDNIDRLYELLGFIESACSVAYYRTYLKEKYGCYCKPDFDAQPKEICGEDIYHPLIDSPVSNSIAENRGVLLTGSNASGKSTFLKTIGINAILAQTIFTCTARRFSIKRCAVYSSMSLRDDLENNESYYIVEIKALKRIIDAAKSGENIICFVDEVLRGTNTVERVSASTEILKSFADGKLDNVLCFAATHDIELTHLLEEWYSNYHFEEKIEEDDVLFNYKLNKGRATSRNAIQLLKVIGYDSDIIEAARKRADKFTSTGKY